MASMARNMPLFSDEEVTSRSSCRPPVLVQSARVGRPQVDTAVRLADSQLRSFSASCGMPGNAGWPVAVEISR